MFKNKTVFNIIIFLMVSGLLLSDPFITKYFPGLTQGLLVLPFILTSFYDYVFFKNSFFIRATLIYAVFVLLLFVFSGTKSVALFSNTFGTAIIGISIFNFKHIDKIFERSAYLFTIGCSIIGLSFYLNLWEVDELTRRSTFINHNQNTLAHLISIGVSFILFFYFTIQNKNQKRNLLIITGLLIIPLLSTVSRTGVTVLLSTIFIYIYFTKDVKNKVVIIFISLFILLSGTLVVSILANKITYVQQFLDRASEAEEDDRINLWAIGGKLAKENLFTGVGFNNFYSEEWRQSVGLVRYEIDEYSGNTIVSISSIHNSFLDLILIGGVFLAGIYISIILIVLLLGYKLFKIPKIEAKAAGAFILSTTIGIILYSYTGQAATYKYTWYLLAINYYLFYKNSNLNNSNKIT